MNARLLFCITFVFLLSAQLIAQLPGNPDNWCRTGFFTRETKDFGVGWVKGTKGKRAYFYTDTSDKCPAPSCRTKAYVLPGDTVITNRKRGNFVCAWFTPEKGWARVGWLKESDIEFPSLLSDASERAWAGEWKYADNKITVAQDKVAGFLNISGTAIWQGLGENVHIGELDGRVSHKNGLLEYSDGSSEFDCKATMQLVTGFMVVADNMHCGGANVTFSGIYWKESKVIVPKRPVKKPQ